MSIRIDLPTTRVVTYVPKGRRKSSTKAVLDSLPIFVEERSSADVPIVAVRPGVERGVASIAHLRGRGFYVQAGDFATVEDIARRAVFTEHYPLAYMGSSKTPLHHPSHAIRPEKLEEKVGPHRIVDEDTDGAMALWATRLEDAFVLRDGEVWQRLASVPVLSLVFDAPHFPASLSIGFKHHERQEYRIGRPHHFGLHRRDDAVEFARSCGRTTRVDEKHMFDVVDPDPFEAWTPDHANHAFDWIGRSDGGLSHLSEYIRASEMAKLPEEIQGHVANLLHTGTGGPDEFSRSLSQVCLFGRRHPEFDKLQQVDAHLGRYADRSVWEAARTNDAEHDPAVFSMI
jgi:hypothetical protein